MSSSLYPEVVDDPVLGHGRRLRLAQLLLQLLRESLSLAQLALVIVDAPSHVLDRQERLFQLLGEGQSRICKISLK